MGRRVESIYIDESGRQFRLIDQQKLAAHAIPIVGVVGGELINSDVMDHDQALTRAHFANRRLKQHQGQDLAREAYGSLA